MGMSTAYGIGSLKPGVCTSTSRPASPFEGQTIYETDTDLLKSWNGSSWVTMGPTDTSSLQSTINIASANVATSQTCTSASYQTLSSSEALTITTGTTAIIGMGCMWTRPAPESTFWMSFAVSGATTRASQDAESVNAYTYSLSGTTLSRVIRITGLTAGSNTFTAQYRRTSTNCNVYNRSFWVMAL